MSKTIESAEGEYLIQCEGCGCIHALNTVAEGKPKWTFNGDLNKPTFMPSLLVKWTKMIDVEKNTFKHIICHSYIIDGKMQYLGDSNHELSGQTIDLPEID